MEKEYKMKNLQNGRSMIEMLGVLAIIGVLSIGGLAGYTMAMNRHRANTVADYVSRVAVLAQTQGQGDKVWPSNTTCSSVDPNQPTIAASCTLETKNGNLEVTVSNLTSAVVTAISNRGSATGISVNATGTAAIFTFYNT